MSVEFPLRKRWELYYDPLYGAIPLHPIVRRALDLKTMQRLRHIKQLSTVYLVYPGATHSRFQHSVGVSYLASRVWDVIQNKIIQDESRKEDRPDRGDLALHPMHLVALQLAALFHDVGHGPWSHVFEMYCNRNPEFKEWEHESMTRRLITQGVDQYHDIPTFLHRLHDKFKHLPGSYFLLPENIAAIATGQPPPCDKNYLFLSQIVSSEYDVDRLDYLRRDALYTGVETGSVDVWEVIHGYVVYKEDNVFNAGISTTAAHAMEGFLFARDLAYRRVYYHKRHRAAQEMLILALHEIAQNIPHDELALYTDEQLLNAFEREGIGNSFTKRVAQAIRNREIYEPLPYEILLGQDLDETAQQRWRELSTGPQTKADYEEWRKELRKISDDQKLTSEAWFIYDMAPLPLSKKAVFTRRYMYDETEQQVKSLFEVLPHLQLYYGDQREEFEKHLSKILLIVPREFLLRCAEEFFSNLDKKIDALLSNTERDKLKEIGETVFEETYQSKFKPLLEHFEEFINLKDTEHRRQLEEKFKLSLFKLFFDAWSDKRT